MGATPDVAGGQNRPLECMERGIGGLKWDCYVHVELGFPQRAAELYASRLKIRDSHACGPLNSRLMTVRTAMVYFNSALYTRCWNGWQTAAARNSTLQYSDYNVRN